MKLKKRIKKPGFRFNPVTSYLFIFKKKMTYYWHLTDQNQSNRSVRIVEYDPNINFDEVLKAFQEKMGVQYRTFLFCQLRSSKTFYVKDQDDYNVLVKLMKSNAGSISIEEGFNVCLGR
jgi:hypothetical protein